MTRAEQCLLDRIHMHEYEKARLVALAGRLSGDDETVANLSAILTTPASELVEPTIRTHTNRPIDP